MTENIRQAGNNGQGLQGQLFYIESHMLIYAKSNILSI